MSKHYSASAITQLFMEEKRIPTLAVVGHLCPPCNLSLSLSLQSLWPPVLSSTFKKSALLSPFSQYQKAHAYTHQSNFITYNQRGECVDFQTLALHLPSSLPPSYVGQVSLELQSNNTWSLYIPLPYFGASGASHSPSAVRLTSTESFFPKAKSNGCMLRSGSLRKQLGLAWCWKCQ